MCVFAGTAIMQSRFTPITRERAVELANARLRANYADVDTYNITPDWIPDQNGWIFDIRRETSEFDARGSGSIWSHTMVSVYGDEFTRLAGAVGASG
jgi:hypothetical protein